MKLLVSLLMFLAVASPVYAYDGNDVLRDVNTYRVSKKLKPLKQSAKTCEIASIRVKEIQKEWGHKISGRFTGYKKLGENLARNFDSSEAIVQAWHNSPTHRAVMTDSYVCGCVKCEASYCAFNLIK